MGVRQRLLDTPPEQRPAELAQAGAATSASRSTSITAAYVGLTEITRGLRATRASSWRSRSSCATPRRRRGGRPELQLVADRFYESMPADVQAGGCNFLEPGGVAAWREKAQQVFAR